MKHIKSIMPILLLLVAASCSNMKNGGDNTDGGDSKPKQFASVTEAAVAAKEDMLAAAETVDFGINKDKLKSAEPGTPVYKFDINWDALLKADSGATPESMAGRDAITIVPLINKGEVITVISLMDNDGQYGIGGLGDKQISSELDIVRRADSAGMQNEISIYEIPNLQATIYSVKGSNMYYTSYNNNSVRQGMTADVLIRVLSADAQRFEKQFRDELKKGDLVR